MGFCLFFNRQMRHMHGGCSPQEMLEEGWTGVESHWGCSAIIFVTQSSKSEQASAANRYGPCPAHVPGLGGLAGDSQLSHGNKVMGGCVLAG